MNFYKNQLKIIDRYIIGKYLGTFVYTLAVFIVVIIIFDLSEKLDDFLENNMSIWQVITEYYMGSVPFYINMLSPLMNFIAVIFFTAKMADQTEIVPILSGSVSFSRFLRPYFIAAFVIFSANLASNLFLLPYTNKIKNKFQNQIVSKNDPYTKSNIHMKLDQNTFITIDNFDNRSNIGYKFTLDKFKNDELTKKIVAEQISYDSLKRSWKLSNYSIRNINGLKESMVYSNGKIKDTILDMKPDDFSAYDNVVENMTNKELADKIQKEKIRGSGVMNDLLFERYKRFIQPLSAFVLTLIGVALSSRKTRGGVGASLGLGIVVSFLFIVLLQFTKMFSTKGGLPPLWANIFPILLFTIIGLILIKKAPK